jgi:hypothetical protein
VQSLVRLTIDEIIDGGEIIVGDPWRIHTNDNTKAIGGYSQDANIYLDSLLSNLDLIPSTVKFFVLRRVWAVELNLLNT